MELNYQANYMGLYDQPILSEDLALQRKSSGGAYGVPIGTGTHTGRFFGFLVVTELTVTSVTGLSNSGWAQVYPAGIYVAFGREIATEIVISAGSAIAYHE